jgi:hypothetical protein
MKDDVIFYPYVRAPKNEWFTQTILYWDKVYSMAPRGVHLFVSYSYNQKLINQVWSPYYSIF